MLTTRQIAEVVARVRYKDWLFTVARAEVRAHFVSHDPSIGRPAHYSFPMALSVWDTIDELVADLAKLIVYAEDPENRDGFEAEGRPVDPDALRAELMEALA